MNVLVVTVDQFRGDSLSCAGHPLVRTPRLDGLAADGVRFARHYSQAAPCAPGRAALYTGTYQLNNRVVGNGTPLDDRLDNLARAARRAGYAPALFGYTDAGIDPRVADGPDDPRLSVYEGVLPGFDVALDLRDDRGPWLAWLASLGYDVPSGPEAALRMVATEPERPAEHGITAFAVGRAIEWLGRQDGPWFAHLSLFRPHPPYAAAGSWSTAYDPADVPLPIPCADPASLHPMHKAALRHPGARAPEDEAGLRRLRAQYYGMISDVDDGLGRLFDALRDLGMWDDTLVVVTSDHGEQLGDHGLIEKLGFFESSYHIPLIVRDPRAPAAARGAVVGEFTENVDVLPTLCDAMGLPVPAQCDGLPLTPFLRGEAPPWWRAAAHWEYDWRTLLYDRMAAPSGWPWDRSLERQSLAVLRADDAAYVQFADGSWLAFDLAADPTWRTPLDEPARVLGLAQEMLAWRAEHADRTLTGFLLVDGGVGRWPDR